jgi:hypothetical protein
MPMSMGTAMTGKRTLERAKKLAALAKDKGATAGEREAAETKLGQLVLPHMDAVLRALEETAEPPKAPPRPPAPPPPWPVPRAPKPNEGWEIPEVPLEQAYRAVREYVLEHRELLQAIGELDYVESVTDPSKGAGLKMCEWANRFLITDRSAGMTARVRRYINRHSPSGSVPDKALFRAAQMCLHRDWQVIMNEAV